MYTKLTVFIHLYALPFVFIQSVVEENSKLKSEVKRLKEDNKDLVKKTKSAIKDVDQVQVKLRKSVIFL